MVSKVIKITFGLVFIVLGIASIVYWWNDVLSLVRGGLGIALILAGLVALALLD